MRTGWTTLVCGVVLGGALGFVAGRIAVSARSPQASPGSLPWHASPQPEEVGALPAPSGAAPGIIAGSEPVYFPELLLSDSPAVHAQAFAGDLGTPGASVPPGAAPNASEPAVLPGTQDAQPLSAKEDEELRNIRRLIEAEMGTISAQDREVWQDVLRGLPAEDALAILRLYRRFSDRADAGGDSIAAPIARMPRVPDLPSLTRTPAPVDLTPQDSDSPQAQLRRARSLHIHNLLNAWTPGFRRLTPVYVDGDIGAPAVESADGGLESADSAAIRPDVQFCGPRIDHREGNHKPTGGTFDLAIRGEGFFVVRQGDRRFYTRCGRFRLNADRRLALDVGAQELTLEPAITVPDGAFPVLVEADGTVTSGTETPARLGQIRLARFLDPAALVPAGRTLFRPSASSGPPQYAVAGSAGTQIEQGFLESSNVDPEQEWELLRQIDELCKLVMSPRR